MARRLCEAAAMPDRPPTQLSPKAPTKAVEWYVISLRPRGGHSGLRRAAARGGAGLIALSPWALRDRDDAATRDALRAALWAPRVIATSPAAARAAGRLQPLRARPGQAWFAVGAGTAAALRRAGVVGVSTPARMDSEGLLDLAGLQHISGSTVGLLSAPGGRGLLLPALQARGAQVLRADVYERVPVALSTRALAALQAISAPAVLALSSGEALQRVLAGLPVDAAARLRAVTVVAASERLGQLARVHGFSGRILIAGGPRPRDLLAAIDPTGLPGGRHRIR